MKILKTTIQQNGILIGLATGAGIAGSLNANTITTADFSFGPNSQASPMTGEDYAFSVPIDANNSFSGIIFSGSGGGYIYGSNKYGSYYYYDYYSQGNLQVNTFSGLSIVSANAGDTIGSGTTGWNTDTISLGPSGSALFGIELNDAAGQELFGWMQIDASWQYDSASYPNFNGYAAESASFHLAWNTGGGGIIAGSDQAVPETPQNVPDGSQTPADMAIAAVFLAGSGAAFRRRQKKILPLSSAL